MIDGQHDKAGARWGDRPNEERRVALGEKLRAWANESSHGDRRGPFSGEELNGADIFWLAVLAYSGSARTVDEAELAIREANLNYALFFDLSRLRLTGANLLGAHLEGANLEGAHLEGAGLFMARLAGANLLGAHLGGAYLRGAHLEEALLMEAHLEGVGLNGVHLEGAYLMGAHLAGANLSRVRLEGARLEGAHLEGANLEGAHLEGTDLRRSTFDIQTNFVDAIVGADV